MSWTTRASIAVVVAVAFGVVPLALDQGAASCEAVHAASTSASAPTCDHESVPGRRIGHNPTPCGHDHHATVTIFAAAATPVPRALTAAISTTVAPLTIVMGVHRLAAALASPPNDPLSRRLSASLRI
jgi:hypothetical protein